MSVDGSRVALYPAFPRGDVRQGAAVQKGGGRSMAVLAGFSGLRIAIWTIQPFPKLVVNEGIPEYTKVAGGAKPALGQERQFCVLQGDIVVVKRAEK